jgi:hypothetical protein
MVNLGNLPYHSLGFPAPEISISLQLRPLSCPTLHQVAVSSNGRIGFYAACLSAQIICEGPPWVTELNRIQ